MTTNKEKYSNPRVYSPASIVNSIPEGPENSYGQTLIWEKFRLLKKYLTTGPILDMCCGNARHVIELSYGGMKVGLDYSKQFLDYANNEFHASDHGVNLVRGDVLSLPMKSSSVQVIYSFSSLYYIERIEHVLEECNRILRSGGYAIIELGNKYSLNRYCCGYYPELARHCSEGISTHLAECRVAGFEIVEHRAFQILPLWCDKPWWLMPLLHPLWAKIMAIRFNGKMIDEWISNLPLLKSFAFRHLIVCRKP